MHATAQRRVQAHSPVTDLVAEPLDHNRPVVGHRAGGRRLVLEVSEEVLDGAIVEPGSLSKALLGRRGRYGAQLANHLPQRQTKLCGPAWSVRLPERDLARLTRRGSDQDLRGRDLGDPPCRRAEDEGLADPALVDHLLIELADAPSILDQVDGVKTTVWDG